MLSEGHKDAYKTLHFFDMRQRHIYSDIKQNQK